MPEVDLKLSYTPAQEAVFINSKARLRVITKGRRLGFTKGAANYCTEMLLEGKTILWVDTISANIQRYFERYFMPNLKQIPRELWSWSKQDKKLLFTNGGVLDMRGADRPENIEGFGYDIVLLNEAGIILKNAYLWDNAISPMLLDNPESVAIIGGVPKGKNRFYDLAQTALKKDDGEFFAFSSFDNPLLQKKEIEQLIVDLGGEGSDVVRQEIYGEFVEGAGNELFKRSEIQAAFAKEDEDADYSGEVVWALDVARFGDDKSALCIRRGFVIDSLSSWSGLNTEELADKVYALYLSAERRPNCIFVDSTGVGAGVYDKLLTRGLPAREAVMAAKPTDTRYANKRAEMYFALSQKMHLLKMPYIENLTKQAAAMSFFYNAKDKLQIVSKDDIRKEYGFSPDELDALAMTYYDRVLPTRAEAEDWSGNGW